MNWILFGFKGSGKSYFASRLGLPFLDTDTLIENRENLSVRELYKQRGETVFRKIEKEIIYSLPPSGYVIALGGGAILDEDNLFHLQTIGHLIYLECPKPLIKKRLLTPPLPSFLDSADPDGSFEKHYSTRIQKYEKIPSYRIQVGSQTDEEIIQELWQVINSATSLESPLGESLMERPSAL